MRSKLSILIITAIWGASCSSLLVGFTPSSYCEDKIIELIDDSEESIDVAIYSINNQNIVDALTKAHGKGIKIRILTDRLQASGKSSRVNELWSKGLNIKVHSKFKIEHNKFAIYDGKTISTGSYNWTNPASSKNSENCIFISNDRKTVSEYQNRFDYLWKINSKQKSDKWFQKRLEKQNN